MDKSNFKIATDDEINVALAAQYRLNLPIVVNETKVMSVILRHIQFYIDLDPQTIIYLSVRVAIRSYKLLEVCILSSQLLISMCFVSLNVAWLKAVYKVLL